MSEAALEVSAAQSHHDEQTTVALRNAIRLWAKSTTNQFSHKPGALVRDKLATVESFFSWASKTPDEVKVGNVEAWRRQMEERKLSPNTVYARISRLASFFGWLMRDPNLGAHLRTNPARPVMPKRPRAYQTEATKSFTDEEVRALLAVVRQEADAGSDFTARA